MENCVEKEIRSVKEYIDIVKKDTAHWKLIPGCSPWFRGQSNINLPPIPGILRSDIRIDENEIVSRFRKLAPMFGPTPPRDKKDEWLYLMQHVGLPTRLLDWSEGALIGLYFAIHKSKNNENSGVWVIHPLELNKAVIMEEDSFPEPDHSAFSSRCDLAYNKNQKGLGDHKYPIAIIPTYSHPRMKSQRGCFTLHGSKNDDFEKIAKKTGLIKKRYFYKYCIPNSLRSKFLKELRLLGVTHSTLFPDHDGLAIDLKQAFQNENII